MVIRTNFVVLRHATTDGVSFIGCVNLVFTFGLSSSVPSVSPAKGDVFSNVLLHVLQFISLCEKCLVTNVTLVWFFLVVNNLYVSGQPIFPMSEKAAHVTLKCDAFQVATLHMNIQFFL